MASEFEPGVVAPRKIKLIVAGVLAVVLLLMAALALPSWRFIKQWRATNLSEESLSYLDEEALELAWERAQSAYMLDPDNIEVLRALALVTMTFDPSQAIKYWSLAYDESGELSDLESAIDAAILSRDFEQATESLELLKSLAPQNDKAYLLEARMYLMQQELDLALAAVQQALALDEPPEESHFLYVQLSQYSPEAEERLKGISYLRELSQRQDELGLRALRNLTNYPQNNIEELRDVIERIREHPDSKREDLLLALQMEMRLPGADLQDNLRAATGLIDTGSSKDLVELGRWLNQQGRQVQTLEIISQKQALSRRDLLLVWLDALAVLGQWDTISRVLDDKSAPIDQYLRLLFQARVHMETGQLKRAEFAWSRAVLQVANDPQKLWFMTDYARRLALFDEARETLERLSTLPTSRRKAYEALVALEQREGTVRALRDRLAVMNEAYPKDLNVQNDLAYANLLLNENIEASREQVEEIIQEGSPYLANRITLALAYFRQGLILDAAELLDPLDIDWTQVRSGWRAVYAAVLRANGRTQEANEILSGVEVDSMLDEERDLLSSRSS